MSLQWQSKILVLKNDDVIVAAWVIRQEYPPATTLSTKYIDSVYSVFKSKYPFTGMEMKVGVMSELVSFQWKNPDLILTNPDLLLTNPDLLLTNPDLLLKNPDLPLKILICY